MKSIHCSQVYCPYRELKEDKLQDGLMDLGELENNAVENLDRTGCY